jgi:hypothetical protein
MDWKISQLLIKILEILERGDRYNHFMTDARRPSGASDGKLSVMI